MTVANTDSLAEQIQRALPRTRVVKSLSMVAAPVMVKPAAVGGGGHDLLLWVRLLGALETPLLNLKLVR